MASIGDIVGEVIEAAIELEEASRLPAKPDTWESAYERLLNKVRFMHWYCGMKVEEDGAYRRAKEGK